MDHAQKIELVQQLNFLEILEHFQMKHLEIDMDKIDEDEIKDEEEFFRIMAGSINRLGQWSLELHGSVNTLLNNNASLVQAFEQIQQRVISRGL